MSEVIGWKRVKLKNYISLISGFPFPSENFNVDGIGLPLIRIRDLIKGYSDTFYNGNYDNLYVIKREDVLVGMDGDFHVEKWSSGRALLNQRILKIKDVQDKSDLSFLYYLLANWMPIINETTPSTTVKHLSIKNINDLEVDLPPLVEQKRIAEFLNSIDKVIELTKIEIEKLKNLKKGMMQDLLTKGIGHTKFKDSPIGKIPEDWGYYKLENVTDQITDGEHQTPGRTLSGGMLLSAKNVRHGFIDYSDFDYISESDFEKCLRRCRPVVGDVLIVSVGATIGRTAIVTNTNHSFAIVRSVALVRANSKKILSEYLYELISGVLVQDQIQNLMSSTAQSTLYLGHIKGIKVPVPSSLDEQREIAKILKSVQTRIFCLEEKMKKTLDLKKGLMQDLLTGKVRVEI